MSRDPTKVDANGTREHDCFCIGQPSPSLIEQGEARAMERGAATATSMDTRSSLKLLATTSFTC
jgi:hypothetical protein